MDLDAAWQLIAEFDEPASAIIKHTNQHLRLRGGRDPGPKAIAATPHQRPIPYRPFGGVLAFNRTVDGQETAAEIAKTFIEAIAAPDYTEDALRILPARKIFGC